MKTKVIALSGLGNTQKSSLIHGYQDIKGIKDTLEETGLRVKIYDEIARQCYHLLEGDTVSEKEKIQLFQEEIHRLETERLQHVIKEKEENIYDVLLFDRTWYDNILYATQNNKHDKLDDLSFFQEDPDKSVYDEVILLSEPTKDSRKEEFDIYSEEEFKEHFSSQIKRYY